MESGTFGVLGLASSKARPLRRLNARIELCYYFMNREPQENETTDFTITIGRRSI